MLYSLLLLKLASSYLVFGLLLTVNDSSDCCAVKGCF